MSAVSARLTISANAVIGAGLPIKALNFAAGLLRQEIELRARLHPFGHDRHLEPPRKPDRSFAYLSSKGAVRLVRAYTKIPARGPKAALIVLAEALVRTAAS